MHGYRTTFSPTPAVAKAIRERARKEGKSISAVVDELLQNALGMADSREQRPFKVTPLPLNLRPGLDPERLREILNDIETNQE